jgi:hypothetical protein
VKLCKILAPFIICAGLSMAQQPATPPAGDSGGAANALTGCLTKGNAAGEYVLTTDAGKQMPLISTEDLSKHIDHKVKVKGTSTKQQEKDAFRVDAVEHVANSCK